MNQLITFNLETQLELSSYLVSFIVHFVCSFLKGQSLVPTHYSLFYLMLSMPLVFRVTVISCDFSLNAGNLMLNMYRCILYTCDVVAINWLLVACAAVDSF